MLDPATCLAVAIYFEARGESAADQLKVANVIINRVESHRFPNDVCSVVKQKHQFSFYWDGKPEVIKDQKAWSWSMKWAEVSLSNRRPVFHSACHYAVADIERSWMKNLTKTVSGRHAFYEGEC